MFLFLESTPVRRRPTVAVQQRNWPVASSHGNPLFAARGFTLIELLAVIAIMALLAALVVGVGRRAGETGRVARTKTELAALSVALEEYRRLCGDYPQTSAGARLLQSLIGRRGPRDEVITLRSLIAPATFSTESALDPFVNLSAVLIDPWGRPYRYAYKTQALWTNASYVLFSTGPDGRDSATLLSGGWVDPTTGENVDNVYANLY